MRHLKKIKFYSIKWSLFIALFLALLQTRLLCFPNKTSLLLNQCFFISKTRLLCNAPKPVCAKTKPLWRTPTCYVCFFIFLLFYLFTLKYCCPVKTFSYGFREAGPLCETHCKPQSGAAVGGKDTRGSSPKGDLCHWRSAGCVSPASRNIILPCSYTHSCTALRLAVGFA